MPKTLLRDLACVEGKTSWKGRGEALDALVALCEAAHHRVEPSKGMVDVVKGVKARLADSNANLKVKAAATLGVIGQSLGRSAAKFSKFAAAELLLCAADNKKTMRDAVLGALTQWVTVDDATFGPALESLLPALAAALLKEIGRTELLDVRGPTDRPAAGLLATGRPTGGRAGASPRSSAIGRVCGCVCI